MPKPSAAAAPPTPTAPIDGAVVPLDAAVLRWTAPPGTASFDVRVAAADAPDDPLVELDALPATEVEVADALPPGDCVWWVRRSGGAWSTAARFRAGTAADVEATVEAGAAAADNERDARGPGRGGGEGGATEPPPDPVWPHATGEALDGAADVDWSTVPGFGAPTRDSVPTADAPPPQLIGPLGGEIVDAVVVALRWRDVPGADSYEVELSPHPEFDRDVLSLDAGRATEIELPGLVPAAGRKLLWRARARVGGAATPWSPYGRFYPAGEDDVDRFRADLSAALAAQQRQQDYARVVRERELDLVPLHERPDAVTTTAMAGVITWMLISGLVIGVIAFVFVMSLRGG
ncbi:hypothetical protein [Rubrivirga litoralis]|uniref:Fibronectin type-III domain-containing protein n=1 Tax=Rubrivirga litoralis TaxID=3075598 RepID=A0ABU3BNG3_9BACT|nr:hypothetical protein [Rubrivirga sp. F394]MDT0630836.1 hypothetical protein [Rubrivirga sp. F394]